jgi:hypothetical protein
MKHGIGNRESPVASGWHPLQQGIGSFALTLRIEPRGARRRHPRGVRPAAGQHEQAQADPHPAVPDQGHAQKAHDAETHGARAVENRHRRCRATPKIRSQPPHRPRDGRNPFQDIRMGVLEGTGGRLRAGRQASRRLRPGCTDSAKQNGDAGQEDSRESYFPAHTHLPVSLRFTHFRPPTGWSATLCDTRDGLLRFPLNAADIVPIDYAASSGKRKKTLILRKPRHPTDWDTEEMSRGHLHKSIHANRKAVREFGSGQTALCGSRQMECHPPTPTPQKKETRPQAEEICLRPRLSCSLADICPSQAPDKGQLSTRLRRTQSGGIGVPHRCHTRTAYAIPRLRIQPTRPAPRPHRITAPGAGTTGVTGGTGGSGSSME